MRKLFLFIGFGFLACLSAIAQTGAGINRVADINVAFSANTNGNAGELKHGFMPAGTQSYVQDTADDGLTDDVEMAAALAARSTVRLRKGAHDYTSDWTLALGKELILDAGATLKPGSGVTLTIRGRLTAHGSAIDESAGGRVIFATDTQTPMILSEWWGADNSGSADATSLLQKWAYSGQAALNIPHYLSAGAYKVTDEIVLSNRVTILGAGSAGAGSTITFSGADNKAAFVVRNGANDVSVSKILFSASGSAGTNTSAIRLEDDVDFFHAIRNRFSGFKGPAIYSAATTTGNLYGYVADNEQFAGNNSIAGGGNGFFPSVFFHSTNVIGQWVFERNTVKTSDAAYIFAGAGHVVIRDDAIEGNGKNGLYSTNAITAVGNIHLVLDHSYIENNQVHNDVYIYGGQLTAFAPENMGDFGGTIYSTNAFFLDGIATANFHGGMMGGYRSNFVASLSTNVTKIYGTEFYTTTSTTRLHESQIGSRMVGAYEINGLQDDGSAALPAFSFAGDPDTGIYRVASDTMGFAAGGTIRARVTTAGILPGAGDTQDLGSTGLGWRNIYSERRIRAGTGSAGGFELGSGGPTWTQGTGVPATTQPNGSLFSRTDGTGPNLYVRENGAWVAK